MKFHWETQLLGLRDLFDHSLREFVTVDLNFATKLHEAFAPIHAFPPVIFLFKERREIQMWCDWYLAVISDPPAIPFCVFRVLLDVSAVWRTDKNKIHMIFLLSDVLAACRHLHPSRSVSDAYRQPNNTA